MELEELEEDDSNRNSLEDSLMEAEDGEFIEEPQAEPQEESEEDGSEDEDKIVILQEYHFSQLC